ncbi:MAG TPA: hypothetical protein VGV89_06035 [Thermoplasmata archaeon]|nr:hypothetical protein [Thermoplasmata archaeon]
MVHVKDEGSVFDAPIDVVWNYLQSQQDHGQSHKGRRNISRKELAPNMIELSWEQEVNGKWEKSANRLTFLPPVGFSVEPLEGPLAGSKFYNYYTPKGSKTEVTVVGEYASHVIPAAELERAVLANNEKVFKEDIEGLRAFTAKK